MGKSEKGKTFLLPPFNVRCGADSARVFCTQGVSGREQPDPALTGYECDPDVKKNRKGQQLLPFGKCVERLRQFRVAEIRRKTFRI